MTMYVIRMDDSVTQCSLYELCVCQCSSILYVVFFYVQTNVISSLKSLYLYFFVLETKYK